MTTRTATFYIKHYNMQPHPEGGYFAQAFRSEETFNTSRGERKLYSSVYFLISKDSPSRFHRIQSDEIWHLYDGIIQLHTISNSGEYKHITLQKEENPLFQYRVDKNTWMAAETNNFAFFGCTLSPGFDFGDFDLKNKKELKEIYPQHKDIFERLAVE